MREQIHGGVPKVSQVESLAARNLQFLGLIETTIDRVSSDTAHVRVMAQAAAEALDKLQATNPANVIDVEGRLCAYLEKTSDMARRVYADASGAHDSACRDHELHPEDGVVEVFEDMLVALADLHSCTEELRHWVETHDALLEPSTGETYANAKDLIAALRGD